MDSSTKLGLLILLLIIVVSIVSCHEQAMLQINPLIH